MAWVLPVTPLLLSVSVTVAARAPAAKGVKAKDSTQLKPGDNVPFGNTQVVPAAVAKS